MTYHGNLLNTEFKSKEFLKKYKILEKRKSLDDVWIHYVVEIQSDKLEEAIKDIQENLLPKIYYAHLYNEDGSKVIVIFPKKVFRLSADNKGGWNNVREYMEKYGIVIDRWLTVRPKNFQEEKDYYTNKPLVKDK
ncbi:MAG: hypothetical protein ABIB61_04140 [Candidatus Shapirobacteria bacterium]